MQQSLIFSTMCGPQRVFATREVWGVTSCVCCCVPDMCMGDLSMCNKRARSRSGNIGDTMAKWKGSWPAQASNAVSRGSL